MLLSEKIKRGIESHKEIASFLHTGSGVKNWAQFTRTHFNLIARIINKNISEEILGNEDLVELHLIIGKQQLDKELTQLRLNSVHDFISHIGNFREYRVFNWVSGKTLQSY